MADDDDDVNDEDYDDDEDGEGSQKGKKGLLIIIILLVLLLGGGGAAAYFMGMLDGMLGKAEQVEEQAETLPEGQERLDEDGNPIEAKITYYELPEFLVNLRSSTNQTSFLKMKATLELPSEQDLVIAQEKLPLLQDHFNTYLRDLRATDLGGSAGIYRLREELLARAQKSLAPGKVTKILFSEILIQ